MFKANNKDARLFCSVPIVSFEHVNADWTNERKLH